MQDTNGKRTRSEIALKIECHVCEIHDITKILGVNPTEVCYQEEKDCESVKAIWVYSTGKKEGLCIESQIEELEAIFAPKVNEMRNLTEKYSPGVCVEVISEIVHGETPGFVFGSAFLKMLAELGAKMKLVLCVHQEKMDIRKVNEWIAQEDVESLSAYIQCLPESEAMKMAECLLSCIEELRNDGKAGVVWDILCMRGAEEVLESLLDIYYLDSKLILGEE